MGGFFGPAAAAAAPSGPSFWVSFAAQNPPVIQASGGPVAVTVSHLATGQYSINFASAVVLAAASAYVQDRVTNLFAGYCTLDVQWGNSRSSFTVNCWYIPGTTHNPTLFDPAYGVNVYGWTQ